MDTRLLFAYRETILSMITKEVNHISCLKDRRNKAPGYFVPVVDSFIKHSEEMLDYYSRRLREVDESLLAN